jgi:hypothetical protein
MLLPVAVRGVVWTIVVRHFSFPSYSALITFRVFLLFLALFMIVRFVRARACLGSSI